MDKKWVMVLAAVGIHASIGSVYAWSVFTNPIKIDMGVSLKEVQFAFSLAILFLGFSASFLGKYVEKYGSKKSGFVATLFFGLGMLGTGLAIYVKSLWLLYLFYGVIGGIGLGVGYITPVSTLVKWFPKNRGLATGFAIMGFGFASLIAGPIIQKLLLVMPLYLVPVTMGVAYIIIMSLAASQFSLPPIVEGSPAKAMFSIGMTAKEAVRTWNFKFMWLILFINIFCGIAIISIASPLAQEVVHMNATTAAAMVGIMGLFNGAGRIAWASFSDFIGRPVTYILFFLIQIVGFYALTGLSDITIFTALICIIMTCYGGGFATIPAYLSDFFGVKELSVIHGHILTSWGMAGLFAPIFTAWLKEKTSSYNEVLFVFVGLYVLALIISFILYANHKKHKISIVKI